MRGAVAHRLERGIADPKVTGSIPVSPSFSLFSLFPFFSFSPFPFSLFTFPLIGPFFPSRPVLSLALAPSTCRADGDGCDGDDGDGDRGGDDNGDASSIAVASSTHSVASPNLRPSSSPRPLPLPLPGLAPVATAALLHCYTTTHFLTNALRDHTHTTSSRLRTRTTLTPLTPPGPRPFTPLARSTPSTPLHPQSSSSTTTTTGCATRSATLTRCRRGRCRGEQSRLPSTF